VPISLLANIQYRTGPADIREENGQLVSYVFVDHSLAVILTAMCKRLRGESARRVPFPPVTISNGPVISVSASSRKRLAILIPVTLLIIFVLLYLNTPLLGGEPSSSC